MSKLISLTTRHVRRATSAAAVALLTCITPDTSDAAPRITIGTQGRIIVDGKPTIPFGLYHISWMRDIDGRSRFGSELVDDIRTMGSYGFSLAHLNIEKNDSTAAALSEAARFNIPIIGELLNGWWNPGPGQESAFINLSAIGHKPAIVAWNICDDINWRDKGRQLPIEPMNLRARASLIKSRAPNHLTYASGVALNADHDAAIRPMRDYRNTADILGFTSYTLGEESGIPEKEALEQTVKNYRALEDSFAETDQALFAIPQLFRFPNNPEPTINEVRNGAYAALMHGLDGIIGYAFYTKHSSERVLLPETNPGLLRELSDLAAEIRFLALWFLEGERSHLYPRAPFVHGTRWRRASDELVIMLSTDRSREINTPFPVSLSGGDSSELVPDHGVGFREEKLTAEQEDLLEHHTTLRPGQVRVFIRRTVSDHPLAIAPAHPDRRISSKK